MRARGLTGNTGSLCQFRSGQAAPAKQGNQNPAARRLADQGGQRGNIGFHTHTIDEPSHSTFRFVSNCLRQIAQSPLLHRVKAYHVTFGVHDEGDKAVLADPEFRSVNLTAIFRCAGLFHRAVITYEIDDRSSPARILALHLDECPAASRAVPVHGESPQLQAGTFKVLEGYFKCLLVKGFGSVHVLHIDLEPADGIAIYSHRCCDGFSLFLFWVQANPSTSTKRTRFANVGAPS